MSLLLLTILITVSLNLIVATVVLINSRRSLSSRYFFILTLSIALWILVNYFSNTVKNYELSILFNKLIFLFTTFFAWSFLMFSYYFPNDKKVRDGFFWSYFVLTLITAFISISDFLVKDIIFKDNITEIIFDWGIYWYLLFLLISIIWSFYEIISKYFKIKDKKFDNIKLSLKSIICGFVILLFLSLTTNLFLPIFFANFDLTNYAFLYSLIFIVSVAFAVLKYNFLNVKIIVAEILVLFLITTAFINIFNFYNFIQLGFNLAIFLVVFSFGILLIKSVIWEVKRIEQLEILNNKLKQTTLKLEKANKELQRLDDAKSEFLSIASHQLRTPTTIIKGYVSMMQEGSFGKVSKLLKQNLDKVYLATERLLNLIENLLDISRIESGRLEFDMIPVDLKLIANELKEEFSPKAQEKNLEVAVFYPDNLPKVWADMSKAKEVASNLVDNAVKYTKEGEISLNLHQEGSSVVFSVIDTGIGMSSEEMGRLFNKFVRGDNMTTIHPEGNGLGLYFARVVIENMGGRIWAESAGKGQGSKFCFSLPLADKKKSIKVKS